MQVALNTRIEYDLKIKLDSHAKESGRSLASIVAEALEKYLNEQS